MKQLEDLDAELTQLGLKPLKIDIKTSDIDDAKRNGRSVLSSQRNGQQSFFSR